jgi:hypothetical protein
MLEVLKAARDKIADPKNWTQGVSARDHNGKYTSPCNYDAVSWCASGAVYDVADTSYETYHEAIAALAGTPLGAVDKVVEINDNSTHAEVLAMFDAAIRRTERVKGIMETALDADHAVHLAPSSEMAD